MFFPFLEFALVARLVREDLPSAPMILVSEPGPLIVGVIGKNNQTFASFHVTFPVAIVLASILLYKSASAVTFSH